MAQNMKMICGINVCEGGAGGLDNLYAACAAAVAGWHWPYIQLRAESLCHVMNEILLALRVAS